jgi:hypothetical protein
MQDAYLLSTVCGELTLSFIHMEQKIWKLFQIKMLAICNVLE